MPPVRLETLKKRREFQRLRGGGRWQNAAFVMESRSRDHDAAAAVTGPRFGFTVTKQLGNAVVRNRIRRRLKAAIRAVAGDCALADRDYVIIARAAAETMPFCDLCREVAGAIVRVQRPGKPSAAPRRGRG